MVDALMYEYTSGSPSLLTSVTETEEAEKGFKGTTALYSYDGTGNMTYASNKALSMIYSYHDMPLQLNTPNGKVQNYYTASGMKIKSVLLPNNMTLSDGPTITNYFDNIEYENSEVKAVYFDEGRAVTSKEGNYIEYFLKDHLGNTRVRISDKDQNNKVHYNVNDPANDEVMSSHHYYPFGMEWDMPSFDINGNSLASAGKDTEYTYNGKEFQDDLGIDLHYYGFRVYDPAIGRFTSVDPIAERFAFVSGFNYAENEPVGHIDLHGLQKAKYYLQEGLRQFMQGWTNVVDNVKGSLSFTNKKTIHSKSNGNFKVETSTSATKSTVVNTYLSQFLDQSSYDQSGNYIGGSMLEVNTSRSNEVETKVTATAGVQEASVSKKENLTEDKSSVTVEAGINTGAAKASIFNSTSTDGDGNTTQKTGVKASVTTNKDPVNNTSSSVGVSIYIENKK